MALSDPGPERPAEDWIEAVGRAIEALGPDRERVAAIGLCGLTPTVLCVDDEGSPLRPVMTWLDTRAGEEALWLASRLGPADALLGMALPWSPTYPPAQLAWLAKHEPRTLASTRFVLQVKDYLGWCLCRDFSSDAWSSKGLCNVVTGRPAEQVLAACGWSAHVVPQIRSGWSSRGPLTGEAARRFGLPVGVPVAVGWSDALAGVLALGAFHEPRSVITLGTSNIVAVSLAQGPLPRDPKVFSVPTEVTPLPLVYGPTQNGGSALEWAARLLGCSVEAVLDQSMEAGEEVPLFVPYLGGERAPVWNPSVRAALVGVSDRSGPAELCRAVLRGVVGSVRHLLDEIEELLGQPLPDVLLGGFGSDHPAWQLAFAERLGRPFATVAGDVSAQGAAMLGAATRVASPKELPRIQVSARVEPQSPELAGISQRSYLRLSRVLVEEAGRQRPSPGPATPKPDHHNH